MRKSIPLLTSVVFTFAPLLAQENHIVVNSTIDAVTVFSDRAMVKRSVAGSFNEGFVSIEVPRLPSGLLDESIRVSGKGTSGAKISGVKVEKALSDEASQERIRDVENQIDELDQRSNELNDRSQVLKQKEEFIKSLSEKTTQSISNNLPKERPSVADWSGMLKFVDDGLESVNKENRIIAAELKDIQLKRQVLDEKLGEIRGGTSRTEKKALVEVAIDRPGTFTFEISYMIMGASWSPVYDVRSWSDTNEIELAYMAMVNQQTGEDWENVNLELSTARPSAGANPPTISAWYLDMPRVVTGYEEKDYAFKAGRLGQQAAPPSIFNIPEPAGLTQMATQYEAADVSQMGVSTSFVIRQKETISSNKESKKVPIKTVTFTGADEYITVPKFSEAAYLKSAITNASDFPILAGRTNIFYNDNFVSAGSLPLVLPKENFNLYFGVDEGMKVKRELVEKLKDDAGIMGKKDRVSYEYKITLQNFHKTDSKLTIVDQIPVSQNDEIDVKLGDVVPPPQYKEGDQDKGFLRWVLNLKPQEKTQVDFKYQVKCPSGVAISGLE